MSLMGMNRAVKKHGPIVAGFIIVIMLGGVVYTGLGASLGNQNSRSESHGSNEPAVAKVGSVSVTRSELDQKLEQAYRGQGTPPAEERDSDRLSVLESIKTQQAVVAAAEKNKLAPTDAEINAERDKVWESEMRPSYTQGLSLKADATDSDIDNALAKVQPGLSVANVKESLPKDLLAARLAEQKLRDTLKARVPADPKLVERLYNEIKVRHILIKSGAEGLPDAQARAKAEKILVELKADPKKMEALAKQYSDDGNKAQGGFYDWKPANFYVTEFSKGAFEAGKGKINPNPVKTSFGYHIIQLLDERPSKTAPADLKTNIAKYVDEYKAREVGSLVQAEVDAAKNSVTVSLLDPGLKAAELERDGLKVAGPARDAKLAEALVELDKVKKADDRDGTMALRRGKILDLLKKYDQSAKAYEEALATRNIPETHVAAAQAYIELKQPDKAKKHLEEAATLAMPSPALVMTMSTLYSKLGDKVKAKDLMTKAQDMSRRQQEQMMKQFQEQMKNMPSPAPTPAGKAAPGAKDGKDAKGTPKDTKPAPATDKK
ncbi:MAG: peptidylprolyl isomerase [Armatimonas sp.]